MEMKYFKKMVGERIYLSPMCEDDAPQYVEWLNDPEVSVNLHMLTRCLSVSSEKEAIGHLIKEGTVFSIVEAHNDRLIGNCGLHGINHIDRIADCGIFIGDKACWNQGYGAEAMTLLLDFGFNLLNLHNIKLDVFEFNARAIACYRKCGFKEIGRRREARWINGHAYDIVMMDMLSSEFHVSTVSSILPSLRTELPT
jgi:RimJ/RimL family protein N-acetyltransferase